MSNPTMNYQLLGRSGLRVSDLCLGTMTFGEDWGWGVRQGRGAQDLRRLPRGGRQLPRHGQHLHQRLQRNHGRRIRQAGHRDEMVIATKYTNAVSGFSGKPGTDANAGGNQRKNMVQAVEASLKRSGHGLHRSLLAAHLGHDDPGGGGHARVRRPRAFGQGALRRRFRHARVGRGQVEHPGRTARLDALRGLADRVQPAGTHRRARTHPHGQGSGHDGARVVAVAQRPAHRQIPAREREGRRQGRPHAQRDDERFRQQRRGELSRGPGGRRGSQGTGAFLRRRWPWRGCGRGPCR